MYLPKHFKQADLNQIDRIIEQNGFGLLVSTVNGEPFASHIPMLLDRVEDQGRTRMMLYGHVARANEHWKHWQGQRSVAIFQGPHSYVSPTWYADGGVPTWNYAAVHLYGNLSVMDDPEALSELVIRLSDQYERNRNDPWVPDFPLEMLNAIVGFSMSVDEIQGKYKLSQNKSETDRRRVQDALGRSPSNVDQAVARMMSESK